MKAFEKWKKENTYSEIWGHEKHEGAELAWRAALEWVRNNEDAHCCGETDAVGEWTDCPKNTAINEELEDK